MASPEISVLMSVYNDRPFLSEAVQSILNQDFEDFEFIIINDGSTDGSADDLVLWSQTDSRIRLFHQENLGLPVALNRGIKESKGALIARMDADDISQPSRFRLQRNFLKAHPDVGVLGTGIVRIDDQGRESQERWLLPSSPGLTLWRTLFDCALSHPTIMVWRSILEQSGGYDETFPRAQDYELWMRLALVTKMQNLPQSLVQRRITGAGKNLTPPDVSAALVQRMATLHAAFLDYTPKTSDVAFCRRIYDNPAAGESALALITRRISYLNRLYTGLLLRNANARAESVYIKADLHRKIMRVAYDAQQSRPFFGQFLKLFVPGWPLLVVKRLQRFWLE
ncbi:MAG: glycosyltransferase [Lamprobacter sp.]|uniref:glycosyltransferase n=1 Tax=Lamprobacter sp. TaxID=3100796 RepID=UPI002B256C85|nr:glycosyltransferase [Lamprobacter sp.]MEA3639822.1 glycosyltransferase [Lamprobacter sp.]